MKELTEQRAVVEMWAWSEFVELRGVVSEGFLKAVVWPQEDQGACVEHQFTGGRGGRAVAELAAEPDARVRVRPVHRRSRDVARPLPEVAAFVLRGTIRPGHRRCRVAGLARTNIVRILLQPADCRSCVASFLRHIEYGRHFNRPIAGVVWTAFLRHIEFGDDFNHSP